MLKFSVVSLLGILFVLSRTPESIGSVNISNETSISLASHGLCMREEPAPAPTATPRPTLSQSLPFTITAYAQKRRGRVVSTSRTFTGTKPAVGRTIAVDPRVIPLHSRVWIEGIGERIAEDTGRLIKGRRIDLFVDSHEEGIQFGVRRKAKIRIVSLGGKSRQLD